jgi:hypothetical protein
MDWEQFKMATIVNTHWLKDGLGGQKSGNITTQNEDVIIEFSEVVDNLKDAIKYSTFVSGQFHRNDRTMRLQGNISGAVHPDDNATSWVFNLVYSDDPMTTETTSTEDEYYIPEVEYGKWSYSRVVDKDKETGLAILNTARDPYDPLPVEMISSPTLSITVKENSTNLSRILDIGSINSAQVKIAGLTIPKYCGMLDDYTTEPYREEEDVLSFMNTYTFKLKFAKNNAGNRIGFKLENVSAGYNYLPSGGGEPLEFKVKSLPNPDEPESSTNVAVWEPVATPKLLDENGEGTDTAYYQEWVVHDLVNFATYGLPTSYPVS